MSKTPASWVGKGMSILPGLQPRPQHHIISKCNLNETINSTSNAMFVFMKNVQDSEFLITGKVGKVTLEDCCGVVVKLAHPVVGGVLEMIRCKKVVLKLNKESESPTIQIDDSHTIDIYIRAKPQLECVYYIRTQYLKLHLEEQTVEDENGLTLVYDIPTHEDRLQIQQIAHWDSVDLDAKFIAEAVVRVDNFPTTSQMLKAAQQREQKSEQTSANEPTEKDKQLNFPD